MNIDIFVDNDIKKLKEHIRFLEIEISITASEISDIEKHIHQYEINYNSKLGNIVKAILEKRKTKLEKEAAINSAKKVEYAQAEKDYYEFTNSYEETNKNSLVELSEEEEIELKSKFRKACKLCHPDKVAEEYKEEAQSLFIELKKAYDSNNLKKVSELFEQLEKGLFKMGSEIVTEKEKLVQLFNNLNFRLSNLKRELNDLRASEVYILISSIKDFDSYFTDLRNQLEEELSNM